MIAHDRRPLLFPLLLAWFLSLNEKLGGLLAGALVTGMLMAALANSEAGTMPKSGLKRGSLAAGSDTHKAAVVGDTVGIPLRCLGSINILIKLMSIVALVFAPLFF